MLDVSERNVMVSVQVRYIVNDVDEAIAFTASISGLRR